MKIPSIVEAEKMLEEAAKLKEQLEAAGASVEVK